MFIKNFNDMIYIPYLIIKFIYFLQFPIIIITFKQMPPVNIYFIIMNAFNNVSMFFNRMIIFLLGIDLHILF